MERSPLRFGIFLCVLLLVPVCASAQNVTGSIVGVVKDDSGAAIPEVEVTAVQEATNITVKAVSNEIGNYHLRSLPVGRYTVTAEKQGFKSYRTTDVQVQINEDVRLDVPLNVGSIDEMVTVTSQATAVETLSSTLKTVIGEDQIENLPLNGRNPNQLLLLVPGMQQDRTTSLTSGTTYPGAISVSSGGARGNATNYILDGGTNNDAYNNQSMPFPNPDALQEFSVQTNSYSAEYGRTAGAVVNAVTKSGANDFHGTAFEYLRHHALNATNFFTPGQDDGLKRNQFGGTLGGPIVKDRAFFFFSFQGTRIRRRPLDETAIVPTAAMRAGDFSAIKKQLRNPFTNQPFANNQIPVSLFSPAALAILRHIPLPNEGNLLRYSEPDTLDDDQYLTRIDYNLAPNHFLFGRFWFSESDRPPFLDQNNYLAHSFGRNHRNIIVSLNDTHTFTTNLINNLVVTYNRMRHIDVQLLDKSARDLGINIFNDARPQLTQNVSGYFNINTGDSGTFSRSEFEISNTVRWLKGRHSMSFGGAYNRAKDDIDNNFRTNGVFSYAGSAPFTGDALADFFLGKFQRFTQAAGALKFTRSNYISAFFQDNFRVNQRLTLNLGLRWDPFFPYTDAEGRIGGYRPGEKSSRFVNAPVGIVYPGDPVLPPGGYARTWNNWAPRVGFAYDLTGDGKSSLRAAYGIFYDRPNTISTNSANYIPPFGTVIDFFGNNTNSLANPYAGAIDPFPLDTDPQSDISFTPFLPITMFSHAPEMRNAYIHNWNVSIEREFAGGFLARAAYAGSKGSSLSVLRDINFARFAPGATTSTTNQRRPLFPTFAEVTVVEPTGYSRYDSLQLSLDKRFSRGFSLLSAFTWSKSLDIVSDAKQTGQTLTNPLCLDCDYGLSNYDHPFRFTTSFLWALPLRFENRAAETLIGGWNLTGLVTLQSGDPLTCLSGQDNARTGTVRQRCDLIGNPELSGDRTRGERTAQWFNTAAFAPNAIGTFGTVGRNTLRGPGFNQVDFGLHKDFPITMLGENSKLQFRAEIFNAFNRVNLRSPNTTRSSGNFGRITSAEDPRIIQLALRFNF